MECPICGHQLGENDAFCPNCGNFSLPMQGSVRDLPTVSPPPGASSEGSSVMSPPQELIEEENTPPKKVAQRLYPPVEDRNEEMESFPLEAALHSEEAPESSPEKPESKKAKHGKKSRSKKVGRTWKLVTIGACLLALISVVAMLYIVINTASMRVQLSKAQQESTNAKAAAQELTEQVADLNESLSAYKAENQSLGTQVADLQGKLNTMENSVNQSTYDKDAALNQLDEANASLTAMTQERDTLQADLDTAKTDLENAQNELQSTQEENDNLSKENDELQEKLDSYKDKIEFYDTHVVFVMIGSSDRYYHKYDCANFTKKNFLAYSVRLAESNGYSPCPVCLGGTATEDTGNGFWNIFN